MGNCEELTVHVHVVSFTQYGTCKKQERRSHFLAPAPTSHQDRLELAKPLHENAISCLLLVLNNQVKQKIYSTNYLYLFPLYFSFNVENFYSLNSLENRERSDTENQQEKQSDI